MGIVAEKGVLVLGLFGLLISCVGWLQPSPAAMIKELEIRWQAGPVLNYSIIVDVDSSSERRRNVVSVRQGKIVQALMMYWDRRPGKWGAPCELNVEQAFPFTIPGLFEIVHEELRTHSRADIRVVMGREHLFPWKILLGPVLQDGRPSVGTEVTLTIVSFTYETRETTSTGCRPSLQVSQISVLARPAAACVGTAAAPGQLRWNPVGPVAVSVPCLDWDNIEAFHGGAPQFCFVIAMRQCDGHNFS